MNRSVVSSRHTMLHLAAISALTAASTLAGCFNVAAPAGSRDECTKSGGVCVPRGDCVPAGGAVSSDCYLDDADAAECCMGTTPKTGATTCADQGGLCLPAPDCPDGQGYIALQDEECGGGKPNIACCIPRQTCGGDPTFQCCKSGILDQPRCDGGMVVCGPQDTKVQFYEATCTH